MAYFTTGAMVARGQAPARELVRLCAEEWRDRGGVPAARRQRARAGQGLARPSFVDHRNTSSRDAGEPTTACKHDHRLYRRTYPPLRLVEVVGSRARGRQRVEREI